jgi:hypothetical protein
MHSATATATVTATSAAAAASTVLLRESVVHASLTLPLKCAIEWLFNKVLLLLELSVHSHKPAAAAAVNLCVCFVCTAVAKGS